MNKKIKWGIAGLGNIAKKFASDLNLVPEAQLVAVASSDIHRAEIFKKDFNANRCYGSYEDFLYDSGKDYSLRIQEPFGSLDLTVVVQEENTKERKTTTKYEVEMEITSMDQNMIITYLMRNSML